MPRLDYKRCRHCGRFSKDVGLLSRHRLCFECGYTRQKDNILQMEARSGPNFTKWRHAMIRCAGGTVPESNQSTS
jgi:ribosomal protein L37E